MKGEGKEGRDGQKDEKRERRRGQTGCKADKNVEKKWEEEVGGGG